MNPRIRRGDRRRCRMTRRTSLPETSASFITPLDQCALGVPPDLLVGIEFRYVSGQGTNVQAAISPPHPLYRFAATDPGVATELEDVSEKLVSWRQQKSPTYSRTRRASTSRSWHGIRRDGPPRGGRTIRAAGRAALVAYRRSGRENLWGVEWTSSSDIHYCIVYAGANKPATANAGALSRFSGNLIRHSLIADSPFRNGVSLHMEPVRYASLAAPFESRPDYSSISSKLPSQ